MKGVRILGNPAGGGFLPFAKAKIAHQHELMDTGVTSPREMSQGYGGARINASNLPGVDDRVFLEGGYEVVGFGNGGGLRLVGENFVVPPFHEGEGFGEAFQRFMIEDFILSAQTALRLGLFDLAAGLFDYARSTLDSGFSSFYDPFLGTVAVDRFLVNTEDVDVSEEGHAQYSSKWIPFIESLQKYNGTLVDSDEDTWGDGAFHLNIITTNTGTDTAHTETTIERMGDLNQSSPAESYYFLTTRTTTKDDPGGFQIEAIGDTYSYDLSFAPSKFKSFRRSRESWSLFDTGTATDHFLQTITASSAGTETALSTQTATFTAPVYARAFGQNFREATAYYKWQQIFLFKPTIEFLENTLEGRESHNVSQYTDRHGRTFEMTNDGTVTITEPPVDPASPLVREAASFTFNPTQDGFPVINSSLPQHDYLSGHYPPITSSVDGTTVNMFAQQLDASYHLNLFGDSIVVGTNTNLRVTGDMSTEILAAEYPAATYYECEQYMPMKALLPFSGRGVSFIWRPRDGAYMLVRWTAGVPSIAARHKFSENFLRWFTIQDITFQGQVFSFQLLNEDRSYVVL